MKNLIVVLILIVFVACNNATKKVDLVESKSMKYRKLILEAIRLPKLEKLYGKQDTSKLFDNPILKNEKLYCLDSNEEGIISFKRIESFKLNEKNLKELIVYKYIKYHKDTAFVDLYYGKIWHGVRSVYLYRKGKWILLKYELYET